MITIDRIKKIDVIDKCYVTNCPRKGWVSGLVSHRAWITCDDGVQITICLCPKCKTSLIAGRAYFDSHKILKMLEV